MNKTIFNDRFNQTELVIKNNMHFVDKIIKPLNSFNGELEYDVINKSNREITFLISYKGRPITKVKPQYKIGDKVGIAQSGKDIYLQLSHIFGQSSKEAKAFRLANLCEIWWYNKMHMPSNKCLYYIKIKDINFKRVQEINELDAILHGIKYNNELEKYVVEEVKRDGCTYVEEFNSAVQAYAYLFDKLNYPGAWVDNPYVIEYKFYTYRTI